MTKKEKIKWALSVVFTVFALFGAVHLGIVSWEYITHSSVQTEAPYVNFFMAIGYIAVLIEFLGCFSAGLLGALFSFSLKDHSKKSVRISSRVLCIINAVCAVILVAAIAVLNF